MRCFRHKLDKNKVKKVRNFLVIYGNGGENGDNEDRERERDREA